MLFAFSENKNGVKAFLTCKWQTRLKVLDSHIDCVILGYGCAKWYERYKEVFSKTA